MPFQTFQVPFQAHVELARFFLAHRTEVVERIAGLLNAQRQPSEYLGDASLISDLFEDCFSTLPGISQAQSRLKRQLEEAHRASAFRPRDLPGLRNGLIDPAEMTIRAFHLWQQTRWPGRNGRIRYAHTLFNLYVIRWLELMTLRLWEAGPDEAGDRLVQLQRMLDQLWAGAPGDQPVFVRDARWLIPLAQSPATDDLSVYFDVAERIADTVPEEDRLEIHKAGVLMAAGHLRSQIRYYSTRTGVAIDDRRVLLNTRGSNALDFALLVQDLVPLLAAYERACLDGDGEARIALADVICQAVSPDPELFLTRVDLLGAYSMIEHLFVTIDGDARAAYTHMGARHVGMLQGYEARIARVATWLCDDCPRFQPVAGAYSPYGVLYGFSTDLIEHMAFKTALPDAAARFGLEDVFTAGDADTLAWVSGWRKLPHLPREVVRLFDYPQQFAEDIYERLAHVLRQRVSSDANAVPTGRLIVVAGDGPATHTPESYDQAQLLSDRREGRCLLTYQTADGWMAVRKGLLTEFLAEGRDVTIGSLPADAVGVLMLMCRDLAVGA